MSAMTTLRIDRREAWLLAGALGAGALTFRQWGLAPPLIAAAAAAAIGVGRHSPTSLSLAASAAAAAAFIHFAVAPEHFREWWGFGTFFVLCGEVQLGWAFLARRRPGKATVTTGLAGSLLLVALWSASRTTGLPLGPDPGVPEPVGTADMVAIALEVVTAACCAWSLTTRRLTRFVWPVKTGALTLTAALTAWALLSI
jgi:hypothetical protein